MLVNQNLEFNPYIFINNVGSLRLTCRLLEDTDADEDGISDAYEDLYGYLWCTFIDIVYGRIAWDPTNFLKAYPEYSSVYEDALRNKSVEEALSSNQF